MWRSRVPSELWTNIIQGQCPPLRGARVFVWTRFAYAAASIRAEQELYFHEAYVPAMPLPFSRSDVMLTWTALSLLPSVQYDLVTFFSDLKSHGHGASHCYILQ